MKFDNKEIKVVWLDLDDTIIDFETNSRRALHRLWELEPPVNQAFASPEEWAETYERHNRQLWHLYGHGRITRGHLRMQRFILPLTEARIDLPTATGLARRYDTFYLDLLAEERALIPGSTELLQHLRRRGVTIGCLSNGFKEVQFRKIRNCGLEPWFDIVVLSDHIGINKPDRRLFDHAASLTSHPGSEAHLMIGDNADTDIAGAVGAGWSAIHFLRHPHTVASTLTPHSAASLEAVGLML